MDLQGSPCVGIDGCPAGWLAVSRDAAGSFSGACFGSAAELFDAFPAARTFAIDIPIGLPSKGLRATESVARKHLFGRASSVFNTPPRACFEPGLSYEAVCQQALLLTERKISKQSFAILPKISEVDACLRAAPGLAARVWEVHPEVSFAMLAGGSAMRRSKHSGFGFVERLRWLEAVLPGAAESVREQVAEKSASDDDVLDAVVAFWTALRIQEGRAVAIGSARERDAHGLRMCIFA
ncbi:DUF429 domain-containing protein [Roseateles paludis]|jgi:predicted RNase H-like nuclease|uniref:DUF429 domain-containing protein n=1 Tax=Roseateles paludis TaxID=3145238 RepID=A0ABV0FXP4_9BURK